MCWDIITEVEEERGEGTSFGNHVEKIRLSL